MDTVEVCCPHCLQRFEVAFERDVSGTLVYDCEICCRPLSLHVSWKRGQLRVRLIGDGE